MTPDKIYLVGFMASGKSTIARALAQRLQWQSEDIDELIERRERRTIAEIFAQQGEPYFRSAERDILQVLQPLRQVVVATGGGTFTDAGEPRVHQLRRRVGLDRRAARGFDSAHSAGRPPAAGRQSRRTGAPVRGPRRHVPPGAPARVRRARARSGHRRSRAGRDSSTPAWRGAMRYLILTDLHANLPALDAVLADAAAVGYDQVAGARRSGRVRRRSGGGDRPDAGAGAAGDHSRQSRQGVRGSRTGAALQRRGACRGRVDARARSMPRISRRFAELPQGPVQVPPEIEICHGAPFDEDYYVFDETDAAQALDAAGARICLFGHTHVPSLFATAEDPFGQETDVPGEFALPTTGPRADQCGIGRPAPGPRPARRLRRPRPGARDDPAAPRVLRRRRRPGEHHQGRTAVVAGVTARARTVSKTEGKG